MQCWFWSVGAVIILVIALTVNRKFHVGKFQFSLLDLAVIPLWLCLHFAMGERFGVSWWAWMLMGWCVIGIVLSWYLLRNRWSLWLFWRRFWVWSGLFAAFLLMIVTIFGFISH